MCKPIAHPVKDILIWHGFEKLAVACRVVQHSGSWLCTMSLSWTSPAACPIATACAQTVLSRSASKQQLVDIACGTVEAKLDAFPLVCISTLCQCLFGMFTSPRSRNFWAFWPAPLKGNNKHILEIQRA